MMILQYFLITSLLLLDPLILQPTQSSHSCSTPGDIRLVDGGRAKEGRVDICYDGYWCSACDDNWGSNEARVACRQLGYCSDGGVKIDGYTNGTGYYKHIDCQGTESSLSDCTVTDNSGCRDSHGDSVGVRCTMETPNRPQSTRISVTSSTSIQLSWTQPSISGCRDIDNYSIQYTRLPSSMSSIRTTTSTTYTISNLALTSYNYECCVWVNNGAGRGRPVCKYIPTPDAPRSVSTSPRSTTSVDVSWRPPSNSYIVTGYNVYYRESTCYSCTTLSVHVSSSYTSTTINDLWPGTNYRVYVKSVYVAGVGTQSSTRSVTTSAVRPSAPRNVRVTSSTSTSLYVHWTTPQYPNGTLTAYTIRCSSPTHNYNSEIIRETYYGTYYTVTGLEVFTAYECCVSATNTIGESNQECVSGKSLFAPPSVPSGLLSSSVTARSIEVSWQQPVTTYDQPYYYRLSCSRTGFPSYPQNTYRTSDHTTRSHMFSNLRPRTEYSCCVAAENSAGRSSDICTPIRTSDAVPTAGPENLQPTVMSSTLLRVSWGPPPFEQRNGIVRHYRLRICNVTYEQPDCEDQSTTGDVYFLNIQLHPYYNYTLTVAAYTVGYGPPTVTFIQMPEDVPSAPPQNITHEVLSSSEIKLSWGPPPLDQQNGLITGYLVRVLTIDNKTHAVHSINNRAFIVNSLKEYTSYTFEIAARTEIGAGPFYMYKSVTTLHGSNFALSIAGALTLVVILVVMIMAIIVGYLYFGKKAWAKITCKCKCKSREKHHVYEEPDKVLEEINKSNSIKLQTPVQASPSVDNEQHQIKERCQTKTEAKPSSFLKKWFKRGRNRSTGNNYKVEVDKVVDQEPGIPERHYLDDMDFMQENRYIDTISLETETSDNEPKIRPEIPPRTYLQDTNFDQELQTVGNLAQTPVPGQDTEKIYQPLIPPRRYEENYQEPSSEYQSLTFRGAANNDPKSVHQSDKKPQLMNHSEGQYQALTKREEASVYEPLSIVRTVET